MKMLETIHILPVRAESAAPAPLKTITPTRDFAAVVPRYAP